MCANKGQGTRDHGCFPDQVITMQACTQTRTILLAPGEQTRLLYVVTAGRFMAEWQV
jgi:hypothetical protein